MTLKKRDDYDHPVFRIQEEMNKLFRQMFQEPFFSNDFFHAFEGKGWLPRLNQMEQPDEYVIEAEIPGIDPKTVEIQINGNILTIKGERRAELERKDRNTHIVEGTYGAFHRSVVLPGNADFDKITAAGKNGMLHIRIGKKPEEKPRIIKINS
ncbi:Hsp20 family protein [Heliobacillus mobilis]|uniref:Hsp20 family protein n=1 Tax=Heliobacterium mobile TaxID=28064 RepID=A0A6I3SJK4_HELMO|nr:Hsp20/alpha crystallin family protein [Heliobacterium mobile]MTV48912.1 Hsp20 family protein [Heliobacterium mobile]